MHIQEILQARLNERATENRLRTLQNSTQLIDFSSNDYLGIARSATLQERVQQDWDLLETKTLGATGSRLITGNTAYAEELEARIAHFHDAEAGLLFNSGYDANVGLLSCIAQQNDTIISDELVHASIIDGIRLSKAKRLIFKHNDLADLAEKLQQAKGTIFVVIESIYSMDGDEAPLNELLILCKKHNANLIVDEAHATGWYGAVGKGVVSHYGLGKEVFARIHTFGKALGTHGAIVLGSAELRSYLINFARSFIYTTALPLHSLICVKNAYDMLSYEEYNTIKISSLLNLFKHLIKQETTCLLLPSNAPIQSIVIPGNSQCKAAAKALQQSGFDVCPILSPTVPMGKERLRICIHNFNTEQEIKDLVTALKTSNHA